MTIFKRKTPAKLIYWKALLLLLTWAILGCGLMLINHRNDPVTPVEFGAILIASAAYLIATTALIQPITKNTCENKSDP